MKDLTHPDLASSLLDALASFRMKAASGMEAHGPGLFSYCALTRERLASVRLPQPVLGVVLSGTKEIWQGMHQLCLKPGEVWTSEGVARAIGMSEWRRTLASTLAMAASVASSHRPTSP